MKIPILAATCFILSAHMAARADNASSSDATPSPDAAIKASGAAAVETASFAPDADARAFRTTMKTRAAAALKNFDVTVSGTGGWLFFAPELRHVGAGRWWGADAVKNTQSVDPANADPLPAILDFKTQLDSAGIELLMVPVAPKAVVYANKIWKPTARELRLDALHREFYALLRKNGVRVLDLTDAFISGREAAAGSTYCRTDTHWSGRATVLAARTIAAQYEGSPWLPPKRTYASQWKRIPIEGDLRAGLPEAARGPRENIALRFVGPAGKPLTPIPEDKASPVILLGDSHSLVFHEGGDMHAKGAGLADQLAYEWGFPLDVVAVRGSGATPARVNLLRRAKADKNYLAHKKLVIWCFSAREWSESLGWNKVPVINTVERTESN